MLTPIEHYFSSMMAPTIDSETTYAWFSGLNHPIYNSVIRFSEGDIDALLTKALKEAPVSFWITPSPEPEGRVKALKERGFEKFVSCPTMSWEVKQIELPKGKIEHVNQETREEFYRILFSVNQFDKQLSSEVEKLLIRTPVEDYLIYSKELPVGTATLFVDGKIGVIFNVAVLPEYQKSGFGSSVMEYAMYRAYKLGLKTLILNSSQAAIKMYTMLGFEQKSDLEMYTRKTGKYPLESTFT